MREVDQPSPVVEPLFMLPENSSRRRIFAVGLSGFILLALLWFGWALIGEAAWGYVCDGREIDFGHPNGCVTTVYPHLQYGDGDTFLGLDILLFWIQVAPPLLAGLVAVGLSVWLRSRRALLAGHAITLLLFTASAALWHLSPGADWELFITDD